MYTYIIAWGNDAYLSEIKGKLKAILQSNSSTTKNRLL